MRALVLSSAVLITACAPPRPIVPAPLAVPGSVAAVLRGTDEAIEVDLTIAVPSSIALIRIESDGRYSLLGGGPDGTMPSADRGRYRFRFARPTGPVPGGASTQPEFMAPAGVGPVLPAAAYTATPFRGRVFPATYERVDAPAASHRRWPTYEVIVLTAPFPLDLRDLDEAFASVPWTGVNRDLAAAVAMRLETEGRRVSWAWFPVPATGRKDRRS